MSLPKRYPRGFALVVILGLLGVVALIAGTLAVRTQRSLQAGSTKERVMAAEDAAYSGLQAGLATVVQDGEDFPGFATTVTMPTRDELSYRVTVNSNYSGTYPISDPDGTEIPPEAIYVKSLGYFKNELTAGYSAIIAEQRGAAFNYPAFGDSKLTLINSLVQAVDSSGAVVEKEAPIRTNGTSDGAIEMSGGSFVDGAVVVGQGGDPAAVISAAAGSGFAGDPEVAGTDLPLPQAIGSYSATPTFPPITIEISVPVDIPLFGTYYVNTSITTLMPGTYDTIHIGPGASAQQPELMSVSELIMFPGDYSFNSLTSSGTWALAIPTGDVKVHVRDQLALSATSTSIINSSASGLQVYSTEPTGVVDIQNTFGNMVLAAQGAVNVQDSEIEGAIFGTDVTLKNTTLSFPTELDGQLLNESIIGDWHLFGIRALNPEELAQLGP